METTMEERLKQEIWSLFKSYFYSGLDRGRIISFDLLCQHIYQEMGIEKLSSFFITSLHSWYLKMTQQSFLKSYLQEEQSLDLGELQELIIHSKEFSIIKYAKDIKTIIFYLEQSELEKSFQILALKNNVSWNFSNPFASFCCCFPFLASSQKFRVTLVHQSLSGDERPKIFIRKQATEIYREKDFDLEDQWMATFIDWIKHKKNILISGATASGKTSFLKMLAQYIPASEHLITIEDAHELNLDRSHHTALINQDASSCKAGQFENQLKELCRHSMRLSPDRLILGEMRGPEASSFILTMNTGHRGLMSSIHANNAKEAIDRTALLFNLYSSSELNYQHVLKLICQNIDLVIHLENKKVVQIIEVLGSDGEQVIYKNLLHHQVEKIAS